MKFYQCLAPIKAISFDLDDTLYANRPVMIASDEKMLQYFAEHFIDKLVGRYQNVLLDQTFWQRFKQQALDENPALIHDVAALRLESYFLGACFLGYSIDEAKKKSQQALQYFIIVRSQFTVPETIHCLLNQLRQHYPLVAISNGNVDTQAIGIAHYFGHVFHAANGIKQKPDVEMFNLACQQLAIKPEQLLHVGDCGYADIEGAINAGCQAAWLPEYKVGKPLTVLPHIELLTVTELADFLV